MENAQQTINNLLKWIDGKLEGEHPIHEMNLLPEVINATAMLIQVCKHTDPIRGYINQQNRAALDAQ